MKLFYDLTLLTYLLPALGCGLIVALFAGRLGVERADLLLVALVQVGEIGYLPLQALLHIIFDAAFALIGGFLLLVGIGGDKHLDYAVDQLLGP